MIIDCSYLALNKADDFLPYKPQRSGVMDGDKTIYEFGYPAANFPIVNMAYILKDFEGNELPPGHYMVVLSPSRKMLYLVESNKIKASVPVAKLVEKIVSDDEEREKLVKKQKLQKKYKNKPRKRPRDTSELETQADMEASIKNTNEDYYVLKYKNGNIEAEGYILK